MRCGKSKDNVSPAACQISTFHLQYSQRFSSKHKCFKTQIISEICQNPCSQGWESGCVDIFVRPSIHIQSSWHHPALDFDGICFFQRWNNCVRIISFITEFSTFGKLPIWAALFVTEPQNSQRTNLETFSTWGTRRTVCFLTLRFRLQMERKVRSVVPPKVRERQLSTRSLRSANCA